jgi:hypothetical protein
MPRPTTQKVLSTTKEYLIGMLLVPWVWIWGFWFILLITYLLGFYRGLFIGTESFRFSSDFINLLIVWITSFIFLIGNYTIYFLSRYSYPRLKPILFIVSLFAFLVFFSLYLPFLLQVISFD